VVNSPLRESVYFVDWFRVDKKSGSTMIRRKTLRGGTTCEVVRGDITKQDIEAIVNAAHARLAGGGGVDGALPRAGGPEIMAECKKIGGCPTGFAVVTTGGRLKAKLVIHAVGPIYTGLATDAEVLARTYQNCLRRATEKECASVAFPSISTGAYGYPIEQAAPIALKNCAEFVKHGSCLKTIRFVLFSDADFALYVKLLDQLQV
jgi:O-acetyl-ADP-ribose deacetylase (regulator of RNase III)